MTLLLLLYAIASGPSGLCAEVQREITDAVYEDVLTQEEANAIIKRCLKGYG